VVSRRVAGLVIARLLHRNSLPGLPQEFFDLSRPFS
jgi:septation ring formation regulator EzrA